MIIFIMENNWGGGGGGGGQEWEKCPTSCSLNT